MLDMSTLGYGVNSVAPLFEKYCEVTEGSVGGLKAARAGGNCWESLLADTGAIFSGICGIFEPGSVLVRTLELDVLLSADAAADSRCTAGGTTDGDNTVVCI